MDKIKEIARYLEQEHFPCHECGAVNTLDELVIRTPEDSAGQETRYWAVCAHCNHFIQWMYDRKVDRVFWKTGMVEIGKLDTGLLMWMMNNEYDSVKTRLFIAAALRGRVGVHDVPDIEEIGKTKAEANLLKVQFKLKQERQRKLDLILLWQEKILSNWATWEHSDMAKAEQNIMRWRKRVEHINQKLNGTL